MNLKLLIKYITRGNTRSVAIKKNILESFAIRGVSIIISLMLVPLTLGYVSKELYGVWLTISSVMMWLGFFDIGFTLGLKNKLAEAIALNKWGKGKALVSTTYFMMIIIFVPLCVILECCVPIINWSYFLNVDDAYNEQIVNAMFILVGLFCIQMIVNVMTSVIAAFQKVALSSLFPVIGNFLALIIIWVMTKTCPQSLTNLAIAISAMPIIVTLIASIILYHGKFKQVSPSLDCVHLKYVKDLFSLGFKFFLIKIQFLVLFQFTNFLISNVSGPSDVTYYNIAYKYLGIAMMAYSLILNPLWPAFTDAYAKRDFIWMNRVYNKMTKVFLYVIIICLVMVLLSPLAYRIWLGIEIPWSMTIGVCIYMLVYNWDSLQVNIINGIGAVKLQTYITLIGLCVHIPLSFWLGKKLGMGALGVVISMITINFFYSIIFTIQTRKLLNKSAVGIWTK